MFDVFVSYARADGADLALRVVDALEQRGKAVWFDRDDIPPAVQFSPELRAGIDGSDAFVIVVTERSMSRESVCREEIEHAVARGKRIVPIRWASPGNVPLPTSTPGAIATLNVIGLDGGEDFERDVELIVTALDLDLGWVREHTRLLLRAVDWMNHDRGDSWLLRGDDLGAAEAWLRSPPKARQPTPALSDAATVPEIAVADPVGAHRQLIEASRRRAERERDETVAAGMLTMARTAFERGPASLPLATRLALESMTRNSTPSAYELVQRCRAMLPVPMHRVDHDAVVTGVVVGPGGLAVTGDAGGVVRATDTSSGAPLWTVAEDGPIAHVALSADGTLLAVAVEGKAVCCRRARTGEEVSRLEQSEPVGSLHVSRDGRFVMVSTGLGVGPSVVGPSTVRVIDVAANRESLTSAYGQFAGAVLHPVLSTADGPAIALATGAAMRVVDATGDALGEVAFGDADDWPVHIAASPTRPWVALSMFSGALRLFDLATGRQVMTTELGTRAGTCAFGPGGTTFAALAGDGTAIAWEIDGWTVLARVPARDAHTVQYGRDDTTLLVLGYHAGGSVWAISPARERRRLANVHPACVAFVPDQGAMVFAHDRSTAAWIVRLDEHESWVPHESGSPLWLASAENRSRRVLVGGERADPDTAWVTRDRPRPGFVAWTDIDLAGAAAFDTARITEVLGETDRSGVLATDRASLVEFPLDGGTPIVRYESARGIADVAAAGDMSTIALLEPDGAALVLDLPSGERRALDDGGSPWRSLAISGDGCVVVGRTADGVTVNDARSGGVICGFAVGSGSGSTVSIGTGLAVSCDGELIAVQDGTSVAVYETRSGRLVCRASHQWAPSLVSFARSSAVVVSASATSVGGDGGFGDLRAMDGTSGRVLLETTLDGSAVALALAADGAVAACATDVGGISLFDLGERSRLIGSLRIPDDPSRFHALLFADRWLLAASGRRVHRFRWHDGDVVADVAARVTVEPAGELWSHATGGEAYRAPRLV